jgi:hypothetical protein
MPAAHAMVGSLAPAHPPMNAAVSDIVFSSGAFAQSGKVLTASLTGATGVSGTATFTPGATSGTNTFALTATGLTASTTYTVEIGSTSIGTFTTDATGAGTLSASNLTTTVAPGSVVTVQDPSGATVLQGTLGSCHHN